MQFGHGHIHRKLFRLPKANFSTYQAEIWHMDYKLFGEHY